MFLKDGKSLLGNWGIIISIIILIVLLFFSYNKCMTPLDMEGFDTTTSANTTMPQTTMPQTTTPNTASANVAFPSPLNPRVNITGSTITLNFSVNSAAGAPMPNQFMVVLVQYDSKLAPTGNNKFYISNESIINPSISSTPAITNAMNATTTNNSLCQLVNGSPACQYIFNNLDMVDTTGNPYYYKIGVSAVYANGNSQFVLPYNVVNSNGIFSLTTSLDAQNNNFDEFIKYKQMQTQMNSSNYSSTTSTPDGQYEFIKAQLGGYPNNLIMDPTSAKQNMLSDLVDKSMAQALLNVNVSTSSSTSSTSGTSSSN
jgi:hypothetical protein